MRPSVVYDTQLYLPTVRGDTIGGADDSDSDWDLNEASRILSDSEPPSERDTSGDESDDAPDDAPMIVKKSDVVARKSKKVKVAIGGAVEQTWSDISSSFIDYLTKAELPV